MKKRPRRWLWMLLCLSLLLPLFSGFAVAEQTQEEPFVNPDGYTYADVLAGVISPEEFYGPLDPATVPDAVGYENALAKKHLRRRMDLEEDLHHVVFENIDGNLSAYYFDYPVKYEENGEIKDISLTISAAESSSAAYAGTEAAAITTFGTNNADGISLSDGESAVTLIPILPLAGIGATSVAAFASPAAPLFSPAEQLNEKTVSYAYDTLTTIEYSLTYTGFKEDIVVKEYTGQTEYSFRLLTNGLSLVNRGGSYFLVDETDTVKGTLGDILIFTADERNNTTGLMTHTVIRENEEYLLTIHVDGQWLQDENTLYPIRIDPTVELTPATGGIEDVTINSAAGSDGSGTALMVGKRQNFGISRILMRFPGLNLNSFSTAGSVLSATLEIRDLMCESESINVYCYVFRGNAWTEATATWANTDPYTAVGAHLGTKAISYSNGLTLSPVHRYSFDITQALRNWKLGTDDVNKGIIFQTDSTVESGSSYRHKTFASFNRSEYQPTLTVNYENPDLLLDEGVYYLNNSSSGRYLQANTSANDVTTGTGTIAQIGSSIRWQLNYAGNGYAIRLASAPTKFVSIPEEAMWDDYSVNLIDIPCWGPENCNLWQISVAETGGILLRNVYSGCYLMADGTTVQTTSETAITNPQKIWRIAAASTYQELSGFSVKNVIVNLNQNTPLEITPNSSSTYWNGNQDFTISYKSGTSGCIGFNSSTFLVTGRTVGIATYTVTHKITGRTADVSIYVDRLTYVLTDEFGFSPAEALLIRSVYDRVDSKYSNQPDMYKAWLTSRLFSEFSYDGLTNYFNIISINKWDDVAGSVTTQENRIQFFIQELGYSETEYGTINNALLRNHGEEGTIDFTHMQYSLSARLAYILHLDGFFSNIGTLNNDETVSYLAGWFGDATLIPNNASTTSFGNDDYMSDLDAENLFRRINQGNTMLFALNDYYDNLAGNGNRAVIFKTYVNYSTVETMVLDELDLSLDETRVFHPDTYNFLMSLNTGLSEIANFIEE